MIYECGIHDVGTGSFKTADCWIVMRSVKTVDARWLTRQNVHVVDCLAPSWDLFKWYRNQVQAGKWSHKVFEEQYAPRYIAQLHADPAARAKLNELYVRSKT